MKQIFRVLLVILPLIGFSQSKQITLSEAISKAQKQSPDYKRNLNRNQASYWRFKNYKARFLPQLRLDATLPEFSNSTRRQTNDEGQDVFVNQNQLLLAGGLSLSQNIPYTGGTLYIYSNLEKVDLFGNNNITNYSVIPFSIRSRQRSASIAYARSRACRARVRQRRRSWCQAFRTRRSHRRRRRCTGQRA